MQLARIVDCRTIVWNGLMPSSLHVVDFGLNGAYFVPSISKNEPTIGCQWRLHDIDIRYLWLEEHGGCQHARMRTHIYLRTFEAWLSYADDAQRQEQEYEYVSSVDH
jgi:hypothetical protein